MDRTNFWQLIDQARADDAQRFTDAIATRLRALEPSAIASVHRHFLELDNISKTMDLWGAADLLLAGCTEDDFARFRSWLIAQGKDAFEQALGDPDSLAARSAPPYMDDIYAHDFYDVTVPAYAARAGTPMMPGSVHLGVPFDPKPRGDVWNFEHRGKMQMRYPKLFARYGSRPRTITVSRTTFWELIDQARDQARSQSGAAFKAALSWRLRRLRPSEIASVHGHYLALDHQAYAMELWGAAQLLLGSCGEDRFHDFRSWLIAQGKDTFEQAVADPDFLSECEKPPRRLDGFDFYGITLPVFRDKTGDPEMPLSVLDGLPFDPEPRGGAWDFGAHAEMQTRYPRLFAKYGSRARARG